MADVALPLDTATSTRLMVVEPGAYYHPTRLRLVEVDLNDSPEYEAISYTWGDAIDLETVHVNGISVQMRDNLCLFLRRLRHLSQDRTFWADALSISQTDLDEKSRQVAMIGRVFKQATCVRAWVGEHADNSEALFSADFDPLSSVALSLRSIVWLFLSVVGTRIQTAPLRLALPFIISAGASGTAGFLFHAHNSTSRNLAALALLIAIFFGIVSAVLLITWLKTISYQVDMEREAWYHVPEWRSFITRLWFKRTWIVQEVALARVLVVHCGSDSLSWQNLVSARVGGFHGGESVYAVAGRTLVERPKDYPVFLLDLLRQDGSNKLIPILAFATRHTRCTDQRDRIYALLSLESSRSSLEPIFPDYKLSVPELCVQTYRNRRGHYSGLQEYKQLYDLLKGVHVSWSQGYQIHRILNAQKNRGLISTVLDWFVSFVILEALWNPQLRM